MRPILFYFGSNPLYSYPLLMGIGWGMAYNLSVSYWERFGHSLKTLQLFTILSFFVGWIGAKVFFLLFSTPYQVFYYAKELNFWLGGGFVFYGGFVFVLAFALLFFHFRKYLSWEDLGLLIPGLTVGHAIGRIGCFMAGCCYGSETDSVFSVHMDGSDRFPVQLIEAIGLMIIFFYSRKLLMKKEGKKKAIFLYLFGYSLLRFFNEFLRGDEIRGLYYGLATSQWLSIAIFVTAVIVYFKTKGD